MPPRRRPDRVKIAGAPFRLSGRSASRAVATQRDGRVSLHGGTLALRLDPGGLHEMSPGPLVLDELGLALVRGADPRVAAEAAEELLRLRHRLDLVEPFVELTHDRPRGG